MPAQTATLAREVLDVDTDYRSAVLGFVSQPPGVRTLRRETMDTETSELARVVSLSRYPSSDEEMLQYLDALDWVLDDNHIDDQERAAVAELASTLGISSEQRHQAHRAYLQSIIAAAERDGIITENEQKLITMIADTLGIVDVAIPQVTDLPPVSSLRTGMRVCFTAAQLLKERNPQDYLEKTAAQAGMQPVGSVTRKNCDLLVAADSSSRSGKRARRATTVFQ